MERVAAGWNEGDARAAADCFTDDAIYSEPPGRQLYEGREALYEFFGRRGPATSGVKATTVGGQGNGGPATSGPDSSEPDTGELE